MTKHSQEFAHKNSLLIIGFNQEAEQFLRTTLKGQAFQLTFVENAEQAKQLIFKEPPSVYSAYLFDNNEHYVENLALLQALKKDSQYATVPVIFQTDLQHPQQIQQSLEKGAYFYLLKPYTAPLLLSVLKAAINGFNNQYALSQNLTDVDKIQANLQSACFQIKTQEDAKSLSCVLAYTAPKPTVAVVGLFELMNNAIEHGNLNISYQEKTQLIQSNQLQQEIRKRQVLPENRDKVVTVCFERKESELLFTIQDSGKGFNPQNYLDFSVARAMDNHGRGILIANKLSFDELSYTNNGNTAIGRIRTS